MIDINTFSNLLKEKGITLSEDQLTKFEIYFSMLVEWNENINLTAITEKGEVYLKHFYDSITPTFYFDFNKVNTICDVGAGAGFPSIPIKIIYPHLKVSIVDSLQKRIKFLNELSNKLELENVAFYHYRAEDFGRIENIRESFDLVTARAVARMSVLSELCLPLVKKDGSFIALKGANLEEELKLSNQGINILGGEISTIDKFVLPIEESERNIVVINKVRKTPKKYPRKPGVPNKTPLEFS
ncbi:MAG: rRNA ((527)-N(7))-methyltransferase RsmG [Bacillales bacterium]|jgi:16S rRNA (guanine527-N7)-methyltransferase|nr:rRNA ((527)-N(7))-methyltransferase RsmG [Bacillales bacterium]